ncbi:MAG: SPOR domain-containing protein, partial [Elsteraceae bacterium]
GAGVAALAAAPPAAPPPPVAGGPAVAATTQPAPRAVSTQPAAPTQTAALPPPPRPAATAPVGAPASAQASALGAGFRVQLAAVRNAEVAATEWARMQRNFPELASLRMTAIPVEIEGRAPFVRIQAGPFSTIDAAQKICADLKARSQGCLVVRP